jgi:PAS domain S-box-containing protein
MKGIFSLNRLTGDNLEIGLFKYVFQPEERFLIVNSALVKMLGFSSKMELKNERLGNFFADAKAQEAFFSLLKEKGKAKFFEAVFKDKNNKELWVAITASCLVSGNGRQYLEGIIENISGHKETEEKLAFEKDIMQSLLDNIPDAVYFKDRDQRIIKVNSFYAKGMNLPPEQIIGKTDFNFFPWDQAKKMSEDDSYVLKTGKPLVGKIERTLLPNGTWNQVITTKIPMYGSGGTIIGTMGITRDMTAYANLERERFLMVISALTALGKTLQMRDPYTFNHNHRVASISERISRELGWDENRILGIRLAGELHDLGKITIPLDILNKPGKLSELEFQLIREHVQKSYDIIKGIDFPFSLAEMIYQHHERLNGSGYPRGLKAEEIILEARILAVSDVLESMTSYRPYRESLGLEKALEELETGKGLFYDSGIVDLVLGLVDKNQQRPFWEDN